MMLLLRPTLRTSRITSDMFAAAKEVSIEKSDDEEKEVEEVKDNAEEEWQEDTEIDWKEGIDISKDADWSEDSDVELAESDEA